jgi:uncharacterized membrane protein YqjE
MIPPEPTSSAVLTASGVGLLIAALGPTLGQYAIIVIAAWAGTMWTLQNSDFKNKKQAMFHVIRLLFTAVVLTGPATWWLEKTYQIEAVHAMAGVAFVIGAVGSGWKVVIKGFAETLAKLATLIGGK